MSQVTIKRCSTCSAIRNHTTNIANALNDAFSIQACVEDGVEGEFAVLVDDVPVLQRNGDTLPSVDEVNAAVENAATSPMS